MGTGPAIALIVLISSAQAIARPAPSAPPNVVVFHRAGLGVYEAVSQEFRTRLRVPVHVLAISEQPRPTLLARVRDLRPQLVFAVGQAAYDLARSARLRPLVSTYVYRDHAPVDYLVNTQVRPTHVIEALKSIRPQPKRLALLSGPQTRWVAARAAAIAGQAQIDLEELKASDPAHALALLRRLHPRAEALWLLADLATVSEQVVRFAISLQFRRRLVLVAPTRTHVRRGALVALDYSPVDLARQAVRAANRVLGDTRRSRRARELARWRRRRSRWAQGLPRISLNRLTAERIDVAVHQLSERAEVVQ